MKSSLIVNYDNKLIDCFLQKQFVRSSRQIAMCWPKQNINPLMFNSFVSRNTNILSRSWIIHLMSNLSGVIFSAWCKSAISVNTNIIYILNLQFTFNFYINLIKDKNLVRPFTLFFGCPIIDRLKYLKYV